MMKNISISRVALFAALIAALGLIPPVTVPVAGGVPITAQTMGVMLAGVVLGPRSGTLAVILFIAVTLLGLPLLSGGRGGLGLVASPSVGFLFGWIPGCFVTGWLFQLLSRKLSIVPNAVFSGVLGCVVVLYAFGILGLVLVAELSVGQALMGSAVFVPGDVIKAVLCAFIVSQLSRAQPDLFAGRLA